MDKPVIIFGAGSLGKAALEILESNNILAFCFLDDDKALHNTEIFGVSVLGKIDDDEFLQHVGKKCEAVIAIDDNRLKKSISKLLIEERKTMPINLIHQHTVISTHAEIGHGNFINAGSIVGAGAKIGNHCLLNSQTLVDHDAVLQDFVQVGAGSHINSGAHIEQEVFIGSGVTIVSGVKVGKKARIGAGSVVVADVKAGETVFGNPAVVIKS